MIRQATIAAVVLLAVLPAYAQECITVPEEIVTLREPEYRGSMRVWDALYGEDGMDQFSDGAALDDGTVVLAGAYTKDKDDKSYGPLLVHLNRRARPVWETREDSKQHKTITRLIRTDRGFTVVGDVNDPARGQGIYLAHYTKDGKKLGEYPIYEAGGDLDAKAIVQAADGGGFVVLADYQNKRSPDKTYGVVYKIGREGVQAWRRAFTPGMRTRFSNLAGLLDGTYMALGQIALDDGRMAAWAVKLDAKGGIVAQRSYPRGSESALNAVAPLAGGGFALAGEVRPSGGGIPSGWVMHADASLEPVWQRYYSGKYRYSASDIMAYPDGRIDVLLDGNQTTSDRRAHIRLLTLSPRGELMEVDSHVEGENAHGLRLFRGLDEERVVTGFAQVNKPDPQDPAKVPTYTFDGWMMATPALESYKDPCAAPAPYRP